MIKCPVVERKIDIGDCVVIVDVCDGAIKERVLGDEILEKKNWREICRACEYHDN